MTRLGGQKLPVVEIGGRKWRPIVDRTVENAWWVQGKIAASGIDLIMEPGEVPEDFAERAVASYRSSGGTFDVIGGLLCPEESGDLDWTPEMAAATAKAIGAAHGPADIARVTSLIAELIPLFFRNRLYSRTSSPIASASEDGGNPKIDSAHGAGSSASSAFTTSTVN